MVIDLETFNLKKLMDIRNKLFKNRSPDIAILIVFFFLVSFSSVI